MALLWFARRNLHVHPGTNESHSTILIHYYGYTTLFVGRALVCRFPSHSYPRNQPLRCCHSSQTYWPLEKKLNFCSNKAEQYSIPFFFFFFYKRKRKHHHWCLYTFYTSTICIHAWLFLKACVHPIYLFLFTSISSPNLLTQSTLFLLFFTNQNSNNTAALILLLMLV